MTNFVIPRPLYVQKLTIDLLFNINRIRKHVTNFKTSRPPFFVDVINETRYSRMDQVKFVEDSL